jgi:hypothetical protein
LKYVVRIIDHALKRLYNIDPKYRADEFLLKKPIEAKSIGSADFQGALFIQSTTDHDLTLGIYFNHQVKNQLSHFSDWKNSQWTPTQIRAFTVATEEISHFNYLIFHAEKGRSLSQFELELQGEVDKFVLTYFAQSSGDPAKQSELRTSLFEQLFYKFRINTNLTSEERERYQDANNFAKEFVKKWIRTFETNPQEPSFKLLRTFYRLNSADKVSLVQD